MNNRRRSKFFKKRVMKNYVFFVRLWDNYYAVTIVLEFTTPDVLTRESNRLIAKRLKVIYLLF